MTINEIHTKLCNIKEKRIIGKTFYIENTMNHVIGLYLYDGQIFICILQCDFDLLEKEKTAPTDPASIFIKTNRMSQKAMIDNKGLLADFSLMNKLTIGDITFEIDSCESKRCNQEDWELVVLFTEFLQAGWNPMGLEDINIDDFFLTVWEMKGGFSYIPEFNIANPVKLDFKPKRITHLLEKEFTLTVDGKPEEKLWMDSKNTRTKQWIKIHNVKLVDVWELNKHILDSFDCMDLSSKEKYEKQKRRYEEQLTQMCPRGKYLPFVEYECEKELSVSIHSKTWLDSPRENNNCVIGYILHSQDGVGELGYPLKHIMIYEPVEKDTVSIEVELFTMSEEQEIASQWIS